MYPPMVNMSSFPITGIRSRCPVIGSVFKSPAGAISVSLLMFSGYRDANLTR